MGDDIRTVTDGLTFLEGPRWHDGRVWFSDFYTETVYSVFPEGGDRRVELKAPGQPSGLGWLPDGRLLVVSMRDTRLLRREPDGSIVTHADLSGVLTAFANDMVVDARGRAYVGEFGFDLFSGEAFGPARLVRVDPDGSVSVAAEDMAFPNGMAITPEGTLLVGETFGNRVSAFDIGDDGSLTNRRVWADLGPASAGDAAGVAGGQAGVAPDGCSLDAEGALWVADAVGGCVVHVLEGGTIDRMIEPGTGVFACMLGGDDGRTLFICAAPDSNPDTRRAARDAALLAVDVGVPRAGLP